jgi:hypothetical protein
MAADLRTAADLKEATEADDAIKVAADERTARANTLLTQLLEHIKKNEFALADGALTQLDDMKGSLPAALQEEIQSARIALDAKKTSEALLN